MIVSQKVPDDFGLKLLHYYDSLSQKDLFLIKAGFFIIPSFLIFLLFIFNLNSAFTYVIIALIISIMALIYAFYIFIWIMRKDTGTENMKDIADCIVEGSEGFFRQQYGTIMKLAIVFAIIIVIIFLTKSSPKDKNTQAEMEQIVSNTVMAFISGTAFIIGAICSAYSGYAGMYVSVRANIRVASSAQKCYNEAIQIAFKGGYFAAVINIALAIFGISFLFLLLLIYVTFNETPQSMQSLSQIDKIPMLIIGFGFGASFVAMFAQLGGGIYTKAADVGADLIGKIEVGIPEDDPRNPAVIADLVGDNVGDCAGQSADLFESISAEIISVMILGSQLAAEANFSLEQQISFMLFPLFVHCLDIFASTIGMLFVKTKKGLPEYDANYGPLEDSLAIMKKGYKIAMVLGIIGFCILCYFFLESHQIIIANSIVSDQFPQQQLKQQPPPIQSHSPNSSIYFSLCGLIGAVLSYLFIEITQYYTDYHHAPVKRIVYASKTGGATNIIAGLSVGMESCGLPVISIAIGIILSYYLGQNCGIKNAKTGEPIGGFFGTAVATMGMFTTGVFILSMSGFGPIADNAGGIVEMSQQPENVRQITDRLDAVGNVTKANTKGYSVGTASMACFLLFSAFIDEINFISVKTFSVVNIMQPEVYIGGLLGSATVFIFSSWAIYAVGNAAQDIISEVRNQFRDNPGILQNKVKPNYKHCVEIVAKAGLREMIKPGLLAVLSPVVIGVIFRVIGELQGKDLLGAKVVCAFLMFATSTGILMALFLNNGGGAWDNAKKYIESGRFGGKGSEIHKAAVIGDTVGDPCKDTAGPSIHILIKLLATITLVLCPLFIEK